MKAFIALISLAMLSSCLVKDRDSHETEILGRKVVSTWNMDSLRFVKVIAFVHNELSIEDYQSSSYSMIVLETTKCNVCDKSTIAKLDTSVSLSHSPVLVVFGEISAEIDRLSEKHGARLLQVSEDQRNALNVSFLENYVVKVEKGVPIDWRIIN